MNGYFGSIQSMMLWALPAALAGTDIRGRCAPGTLVERVVRAGRPIGSAREADSVAR